LRDERAATTHDYSHKRGVLHSEIVVPAGAPEWAAERAALWNAAERAETRKNSCVAREWELAIPCELDAAQRAALVRDYAQEIVEEHGIAVDVCIHAPHREGDGRNYHAHLLATTRRVQPAGLGEKTRELDDQNTGPALVTTWRERWAALSNEHLVRAGHEPRMDHRSHADRGIEATPGNHLGVAAIGYERRTGRPSEKRLRDRARQEESDRLSLEISAEDREMAALKLQSKGQDDLDLEAKPAPKPKASPWDRYTKPRWQPAPESRPAAPAPNPAAVRAEQRMAAAMARAAREGHDPELDAQRAASIEEMRVGAARMQAARRPVRMPTTQDWLTMIGEVRTRAMERMRESKVGSTVWGALQDLVRRLDKLAEAAREDPDSGLRWRINKDRHENRSEPAEVQALMADIYRRRDEVEAEAARLAARPDPERDEPDPEDRPRPRPRL